MRASSLLPERVPARVLVLVAALAALVFLTGRQGGRVGSSMLPSETPAGVWLALVVAVLLLPRAARPARPSSLAWVAGALALAAWPLGWWRSRVALPPVALTATVTAAGPATARPERVLLPDFGRLRRSPPWHRWVGRNQDFVLDIQAWLWVPRSATYRFELQADDQATLKLDGAVAMEAVSRAAAGVPLTRGVHAVTLRLEQGLGAASLALDWDGPAFVEPIPLAGYLAGRPEGADPSVLLRRHAATLASLLLAWLFWIAFALTAARLGESYRAWPALGGLAHRGLSWARRQWDDRDVRLALLAFAASAVFIFGLEKGLRSRARDGLYFQEYPSEYLMQTVSVADLREEPWRSLFYLHIQPPALDAIRAALARLHEHLSDESLQGEVDRGLYLVWGAAYAALVALFCRFMAALTSRRFAAGAALVIALHPALLFYATLLDSTLLSALLFAWFSFELWRWSCGPGSVSRLAASVIALFLTRSVFQWPFLLVLALSLALLRVPWRKAAAALGIAAVAMGLYVGKQYALFGITTTSTFAANSFCRGLGLYCQGTAPVELPVLPSPSRARVLSRTAKLDGEYNYNQLAFLRRSFSQMAEYRAYLRDQPLATTLGVWRDNLRVYLQPSSRYTAHALVDRLPWRSLYDAAFSGWPLVLLVAAAGGAASMRAGPRRALGLALPSVYVMLVTVVFEGGEHMRYKFFIEPVVLVLLASQAYQALIRARSLVPRRNPSTAPT